MNKEQYFLIQENEPDEQNILSQEVLAAVDKIITGHFRYGELKQMSGEDNSAIAVNLIDQGYLNLFSQFIHRFHDLSQEVALRMVDRLMTGPLINAFKRFNNLDYQEIALRMIKNQQGDRVLQHLEKFKGIDINKIVLAHIYSREGYSPDQPDWLLKISVNRFFHLADILKYMEKIAPLNREVALALVCSWRAGNIAAHNLDKFEGLDQEIAQRLIDQGYGDQVKKNTEKFNLENSL